MARSSLDPSLLPEEHLQAPMATESVTLETAVSIAISESTSLNSNSSSNSSCFLPNASALALHQIQSTTQNEKVSQGIVVLDGPDQMMNDGANTPMSSAEIMNLLLARQKQEEEEEKLTSQQESIDDISSDKEPNTSSRRFQTQDDRNDPPTEFYSSLDSTAQEAAYEDISSNAGAVSLGENNITTIELPDGQILSLGEETLGQIAGLTSFSGGSIALATTQGSDGTHQIQYIIKQPSDMKEKPHHYETFQTDEKPYPAKPKNYSRSGSSYTCYVCQKTFPNQSELQKHTKLHLGQKEYVCDVPGCKKEYTTSHHLKVHKRQHSGERPFTCEWEGCGKMFTTGYGLKSHFRTHTNERPYKCQEPDCGKAFKTSGDLQKHIRTHTGERPFVCPYEGCKRSFTTSNIRKVHLRTHTGEKPYKCEIETCGRTFASATNYKNHSRIHTGERPYVCEVPGCLKRFTEYSSLYKHNIVHTQQKPYTCTLCHKTYRQTSTLAMHKRTVHGTTDELTEAEKREVSRCIPRRPKISRSNRLSLRQQPKTSTSSTTSESYLQGMSLVINNTPGGDQQFSADITSHLTHSSEIPGAIAIPIQVTMNPDGTIAGAQGLNLTDGSGRMIPVNLSVSIPMSSFQTVTGETITDSPSMANVMSILTDSTTEVAPTGSSTDDDDDHSQLTPRILTTDGNLVSTVNVLTQTPVSSTALMNAVLNHDTRAMQIQTEELSNENFDTEEDDVTDKYLTSHYT